MDWMYKQIIKKAKDQGFDWSKKKILIPKDENIMSLNGEEYTGKIFSNNTICILKYNQTCGNYEEYEEPFIFRIIDQYQTYLSNGTMYFLTNFFIVE